MIHLLDSKINKYAAFLTLTEKEKSDKLNQARHLEEPIPDPLGHHIFPDINFIPFQVEQRENNISLCTYRYPAQKNIKAVLFMIHGLNSHINQGAHLAHHFAQHGIETVGFDHRGFGRSEGQPGYMDNFETHLQDCLRFYQLVKPIYEDLPFFCLGQSMGGLTTYRLSLLHPNLFEGVIMMAPALKKSISKFVVKVLSTLKFFLPEYMKMTTLPLDRSCRNKTMVKRKEQDIYYYKQRFSLATVSSLLNTMSENHETYKDFRCPFLLVQGGMDRSVDPSQGFKLFLQCPLGEEDKDLLFYQDMWHDIWYQPQIDEIIKEVINWIDCRLKKGKDQEKAGLNPEKH